MIAKVSHKFASANHEKIKEKILYWANKGSVTTVQPNPVHPAYKGLDVEEEHTDRVVLGLVQLEEVHSGVLQKGMSRLSIEIPRVPRNIVPLKQRRNHSANDDAVR